MKLGLCMFILALALSGFTSELGMKGFVCRKAKGKIKVDGILDEKDWQRAYKIDKFYLYNKDGALSPFSCIARLLWNNNYLYLGFELEDPDIYSFSANPDAKLWRGDVGELFLKPSKEEKAYYEFVVSPEGALYDAYYPSRAAGGFARFNGWQSNAKTAVKVYGTINNWKDNDRGYVIEMAIPMSAFEKNGDLPKAGSVWLAAINRWDFGKDNELPLEISSFKGDGKTPRLLSGFHRYELYDQFFFVDDL